MPPSLPSDLPVEHTLRFVVGALPPGASRVLEVGCGRGALSAKLKVRGLDLTAIDLSTEMVAAARERGVEAVEADFLTYQDQPFDALLFSRSLHHLVSLTGAIERAYALVRPGGTVIAEEFAVDQMDQPTARWFYELTSLLEASGLLPPEPGGGPLAASQLERWYEEHAEYQPLHAREEMVIAIGTRFDVLRIEDAPALYRTICGRIEAGDRGARVAQWVMELESLRVAERSLRALGLRVVARKPG